MNTKTLMLSSLFIVTMLFMVGAVSAATLNVGGGGAYTTIQAAIDAATPGDIIYVAPGIYTEDLTITKTLELVGASNVTTIIKGVANVYKTDWPLAVPNIDVQADGVSIHGFRIEGPDYEVDYYASGMVLDGQNIELYDNIFVTVQAENTDELGQAITTYSSTAIPTADVSNLLIHDNVFIGSGATGTEAIYINPHTGSGNVTVVDNKFVGSIFIGLSVESGNMFISGNAITGNSSGLYGMRFFDTSGSATYDSILVSGNTIDGFASGLRVGNTDTGSTSIAATLDSNVFLDNTNDYDMRNGASVTYIENTHDVVSGESIQSMINNAGASDIISVGPGTYAENVNINKALTLQSVSGYLTTMIAGTSTVVSINADDVTVGGFTITTNGGAPGVGVYAADHSNLVITNNNVTAIGDWTVDDTSGQGIVIVSSAAAVDSVEISNNVISDIESGIRTGSASTSAKGIAIGWATGDYDITNLVIQNNHITNILVDYSNWTSTTKGQGANGILINHGASGAGQVVGALIQGNTVYRLEGLWVHAIGLEGDTPNAVVTGNYIGGLTDHKDPSDAVAVFFEANPNADSVTVENNALLAPADYGVAMHPDLISSYPALIVNASNNWWGTAVKTEIAAMVSPNVTFEPYCLDASCASTGTDEDSDGYLAGDDCDDSNAAINPGATEVLDGVDNNCDGVVDDASAVEFTGAWALNVHEALELLKGWVDDLTGRVSDLETAGYLTSESDPDFHAWESTFVDQVNDADNDPTNELYDETAIWNAHNELSTNVTGLHYDVFDLQNGLAAESGYRVTGDVNLSVHLANEIANREAGDSALDAKMNTLGNWSHDQSDYYTSSEVDNAIAAEATVRNSVDIALNDSINDLENRAPHNGAGIDIYFTEGWNEFRLPWFVLMGTNQTVNGLDLYEDYSVANVLAGIDFNYLAYYNGTGWETYIPGNATATTFTEFPTEAEPEDFVFHIYVNSTTGARLDIGLSS